MRAEADGTDGIREELAGLLRLVLEKRSQEESEDRIALRGSNAYAERILPLALEAKQEELAMVG